jgi:hypothetical protein
MTRYLQPPPLNTARIAERKKALAEIRAENEKAIHSYELLDPGKGFVRLRVDRAMELTVEDYKNPAGRSGHHDRARQQSRRTAAQTSGSAEQIRVNGPG